MAKAAWREKWQVHRQLSGGGQGDTFLVHPVGSTPAEAKFVLKQLKDQKTQERRERLYLEVASLKILEHPGVARLVDSNAEQYKSDEPLYLVTELIDGSDLEGFVQEPLAVETACGLMLALLGTLEYCHEKDVLHRDIKPSNVIVRGNDPQFPVLIDFGLAFCPDLRTEGFETYSGQHLGNRFLQLPEYHTRGADKRTVISDITQCAGLLFYLVTKDAPDILIDNAGKKPHERPRATAVLSKLPKLQQQKLARIFDVGFNLDSQHRWQSIETFQRAIRDVGDANGQTRQPLSERLKAIKDAAARNRVHTTKARVEVLMMEFQKHYNETLQEMNGQLQNVVALTFPGVNMDVERSEMLMNCLIAPKFGREYRFALLLRAEKGELHVLFKEGHANDKVGGEELLRVNLFDSEASVALKHLIEDFVTSKAMGLVS